MPRLSVYLSGPLSGTVAHFWVLLLGLMYIFEIFSLGTMRIFKIFWDRLYFSPKFVFLSFSPLRDWWLIKKVCVAYPPQSYIGMPSEYQWKLTRYNNPYLGWWLAALLNQHILIPTNSNWYLSGWGSVTVTVRLHCNSPILKLCDRSFWFPPYSLLGEGGSPVGVYQINKKHCAAKLKRCVLVSKSVVQ